ncbi:YtxH domain-containing protein [Panacibacter sp. DH6]|uniref:YtxH domain-containing protein n=1 Tax=Panacibacter microcysteis TaxID=2793269 RepID=A0A931E1X3_9BACT|nr:YtxH domain-containing protein [Panacibacter microcysteis]MBG9376005.1 YtxH domain-containing protein [Panacibacter microcysteis]
MHLATFIRGISIGFIVGVLFAPDSGKATRRKLSGVATDIKEDFEETYDDISSNVKQKVDKVKHKAADVADRAGSTIEDIGASVAGNP